MAPSSLFSDDIFAKSNVKLDEEVKEASKEFILALKSDTGRIAEVGATEGQEESQKFLDTQKTYKEIGVSSLLEEGLYKLNKDKPSQIQSICIPTILSGANCAFHSQSGSGKTLAFATGVLARITPRQGGTQAIILTPVRELNSQVYGEIAELSLNSVNASVFQVGGDEFKTVVTEDIVVGCPKAVLGLIIKKVINIDNLQMIVCDEADRLLSARVFAPVTHKLLTLKECQKVFFSATYNLEVQNVIRTVCHGQIETRFTHNKLANNLRLYWCEVDKGDKIESLGKFFDLLQISAVIIFVNTKKGVIDVTKSLVQKGYPVSMIHGDATKEERDKVHKDFRGGKTKFLVSTDLFGRGIDIPHVNLVINYDIPEDYQEGAPDVYNHRVGRTGRFNRDGFVIDMVCNPEEYARLNKIYSAVEKKSKQISVEGIIAAVVHTI